jgi:diguanylate cyclase (GGDEF)-like protein
MAHPTSVKHAYRHTMQRLTDDPFARRLFADAQEGIAVFDESGSLIAWNAAARAITGWDEAGAATQDLLAKGAGILQIREGKWVDLRRSTVATPQGELRLVLFADATANVSLVEARRHLADGGLIDRVTSLAGPQIAVGHLERSVALAQRDLRAVGVLSVGVDIPHVAEDVPMNELMAQLGKRVIAATRTSDLAARFSESEILIVLTAMAHAGDAAIVAVRLLLQLSRPYVLQGRERSATISVGIASFPTDADGASTLLDAARATMARARSAGGGYQVASPAVSRT